MLLDLNMQRSYACSAPGPKRLSLSSPAQVNHGVFICDECYGSHRNVGAHVSKTKSVTLDEWTAAEANMMERGNEAANAEFEATMTASGA